MTNGLKTTIGPSTTPLFSGRGLRSTTALLAATAAPGAVMN